MTDDELKQYEAVKQEAAAKADEWFRRDPEYWRDGGREAIAACLDADLPNPLDDIRGGVVNNRPNRLTKRTTSLVQPTFHDDTRALRAYRLSLIILHDLTGGYRSIAGDLWPSGGIPVSQTWLLFGHRSGCRIKRESKAQVCLWDDARFVFDELYGTKIGFIQAALRTVERDIQLGEASGATLSTAAPPEADPLWHDIPDDYQQDIEVYETEAKALKREGHRLKIDLFCERRHLDADQFRSYRNTVRSRRDRARSKT